MAEIGGEEVGRVTTTLLDGGGTDAGDTIDLTLGADDETGSANNDLFVAGVEGSAATTRSTLDSQDILDGLGGVDTLRLFATSGDTTIAVGPELANIEELEIRASTGATVDLTGASISGLETISIRGNAGNALTASVADETTIDLDQAGTGAISVAFTSSNDDTIEISSTSSGNADTSGDLTIDEHDNISVLSFVDITGDNFVDVAVANSPNAVETLEFTGSGSFDAGSFAGTGVTSVDSSGLDGGLTIDISAASGVNQTVTGGSGDDDVTLDVAGNDTVSGAGGQDRFDISGTTAALDGDDEIDGGADTDTLAIDFADLGSVTSDAVSNIEVLEIAADTGGALTGTIDFDNLLSGITQFTIATSATGSVDFDNADEKTVNVVAALGDANDLTINDDTADDSVTVNFNSEDAAITNAATDSDVTLAAIENATINLTAGTNALTLGAVSATGADTVDLSITEGDLSGGSVGAVTIDSVTADSGDVSIDVGADGVSVTGAVTLNGADSVDLSVTGDTFSAATLVSDASDVSINLGGDSNTIAAATLSGVTALTIDSGGTSNSIGTLDAASLVDLTIDVNSGDFTVTADTNTTALETVDVNGSGDIDFTAVTGQTNLTMVDLRDYTGELADDSIDLSATTVGVTIEVGAVDGDNVVGTAATASTNGDIVLGGTNAVKDEVVFNQDFSGSVAIENFEAGGDVLDDNIDLSAFDISAGTNDLDIAADGDGGDTVISSATDDFSFEIVLTGVNPVDVNSADFVF